MLLEKLLVICKGLFLALNDSAEAVETWLIKWQLIFLPKNCTKWIGAFRIAKVYLRFFDSVEKRLFERSF